MGCPPGVAGWVFFAGSVCFTSAALLQFLTSRRGLESLSAAEGSNSWRAALIRPRTLDWAASAVQLVGTIAFNISTFRAALDSIGSVTIAADVIWRPDAFGSVLFLVSSGLAFAPEVRGRRHRHARDRAWAIGALNMLGSVFFGASAIGAYTVSATGVLLSARWSNLGTFLGAICFLAGARLLLPRGDTSRG
ncbi:MAG: hypothetical protein ABI468_11675 [Candidatus Nanopelagicales bacterium]